MAKRYPEKTLINASLNGSHDGVNHILFIMIPEGEIKVLGAEDVVKGLYYDQQLFQDMQNKILENSTPANYPTKHFKLFLIRYDPLPFSPYSPKWKGTVRIHSQRTGHHHQLDVGPAPLGWPEHVSLENLRAPSDHSCQSKLLGKL